MKIGVAFGALNSNARSTEPAKAKIAKTQPWA